MIRAGLIGLLVLGGGSAASTQPAASRHNSLANHGAALPAPPFAETAEFLRMNVIRLPGVAYEVLKSGPADGVPPTRADTITVRYSGRLPDGAVFDTSADAGRGTTTFELARLIPGWVAALQLMRPGDRWILTLPPYLAYGRLGKPAHGIPPEATLTFDVELVSVKPAPPPPSAPKDRR